MKNRTGLMLAAFLISVTGCVSIESSGISDSPKGVSGTEVRVTEQGDFGILHLTSPTDLTAKANQDLLSKCSSGRLSNVQTQLSDRDWLGIVQVYKVRARAICM